MKFDWDPDKAKTNLTKHGISFEEAQEAFDDPDKMEVYQRATGEDRWKMLAKFEKHILVVVYRDDGDVVRIISAREAEKHEKARYRSR